MLQLLSSSSYYDTVYILYKGVAVGTLTQEMNDATETAYFFEIFWDAWDNVKDDEYLSIEGLDMDLRKKYYIRYDLPYFVDCHLPPSTRSELPMLMYSYGMKRQKYDKWEYMKASHRHTLASPFRVCAQDELDFGLAPLICTEEYYKPMCERFQRCVQNGFKPPDEWYKF